MLCSHKEQITTSVVNIHICFKKHFQDLLDWSVVPKKAAMKPMEIAATIYFKRLHDLHGTQQCKETEDSDVRIGPSNHSPYARRGRKC